MAYMTIQHTKKMIFKILRAKKGRGHERLSVSKIGITLDLIGL